MCMMMSPGNKRSFVIGLCHKLRMSGSPDALVDSISAVLLQSHTEVMPSTAEHLSRVYGAHHDNEALRVTHSFVLVRQPFEL